MISPRSTPCCKAASQSRPWSGIRYTVFAAVFTEPSDPAILHFVGRRKPWSHLNGEFPVKYANACRVFFRDHFPERFASMPAAQSPSQVRLRHMRYFLVPIIGLRRVGPAMDRFSDDFVVEL